MKLSSYYYNSLPRLSQQAYYAVLTGLGEIAPSFAVPRLPMETLSEIFFLVRLDHPEIFYAVSFSCRAAAEADCWEFLPEYMFPKKQILEHRKMLEARTARLVRGAEGLDAAGRETYVHDFLCSSVRYDKLRKPYSHEIIGVLEQGVAVCEGIAKTAKHLCDALGIPCIVAVSEANPAKGIRYRHAWNIVLQGGTPYHLDATFDNTLSSPGHIRYDYYNINDDRLFRDHEPALFALPACRDGRHDWFTLQKLGFSDLEKLRGRAAQAARKNTGLVFRWNGGYLTREIIAAVLTVLKEEAAKRGVYASLAANVPQAVFQVSFHSSAPAEELTVEHSDAADELTVEHSDAAGQEDTP